MPDIRSRGIDPQKKTTANVKRLISIFAKQYEGNPRVILRELIQNAADAITVANRERLLESPRISIEIPAEGDREKFDVDLGVRDSARGMDEEDFWRYLACLGEGTKEDDLETIGEWGIGFFSVVVACNSALIATKRRDSDPVIYRYHVSEDCYTKPDASTCEWVLNTSFTNSDSFSESGTVIYFDIDFDRCPQLRDWLNYQRLVPEVRSYCLLVPHPIVVRDLQSGESKTANLTRFPWEVHEPERKDALKELWSAILIHSEPDEYPQLAHCFSVRPDKHSTISGVVYYIPGCRGGVSTYYKSIYVEGLMDALPLWASPFTVLANAKTTPKSVTHLEVPPSRSHVVRDEKFRRFSLEIENQIVVTIQNSMRDFVSSLQAELAGSDQEHRSERFAECSSRTPIVTAMSDIGDFLRSICMDLGDLVADALSNKHSERIYLDAAVRFLSRHAPGITRETIVPGLRKHAEVAREQAEKEWEEQKSTHQRRTWCPDASLRFIEAVGEHVAFQVVVKEYPHGRQASFELLRVPLSCLRLIDPALQKDDTVRIPVLVKGEAADFLYNSPDDRLVVLAPSEEQLLYLACLCEATGRYELDIAKPTSRKFAEVAHPETWTDFIMAMKMLLDERAAQSAATCHNIPRIVDIAGYDRKAFPLILREKDGESCITINAWNRSMRTFNDTFRRSLERGLARVETALRLMIRDLYNSSVYEEDTTLSDSAMRILDVREQLLIEICELLTEFTDVVTSDRK